MTHTHLTVPTAADAERPSRAAAIWLTAAQVVAVALLGLALYWSYRPAGPDSPAILPARPLQAMLGVIALAAFVMALAPAWRRSAFAGALCGAALAIACWLSAGVKTWFEPKFFADIPLLAFVMPAAALALAIWGLIARGGMKDGARLGAWALCAGLGLLVCAAGFFGLLTSGIGGIPVYQKLDALDTYFYQYELLLANILLYPAALWIGSIGLRKQGGLAVQPLLTALVIGGALLWWNR